jgi:hypothetical protein
LKKKNKLLRDDFECRKKDLKEKITKKITDNQRIKEQLADTILKNPAFQKLNNQLHEMKNEITKLDNIDNHIAKLTLEAELQKDEINKLKKEASHNLTLVVCIKKLDEMKVNLSNLNYDDVLNRINDLQLAISSERLLINPTSIEIYNKHIKDNIINFVTTTKSSAKNREEWVSLAREATNSAFRHEIKKELIESESKKKKIEKIVSEIKRGTTYINSLNQTLLQSAEIQKSEKKLKTIESELLSLTSTASQRQKNRLCIESEFISIEQKIKKLEYEINTAIILKAKDIIDKNMEKELDEIIKKSNEYKNELQNKASFLTQEVEEKLIPFFHSTFSESFKHSCDFLHEIYSDNCELTYERQGNNGTCVLSAINSALNNRNKMPLTPFRLEVFSRDLAIIEINKFLTEAERKNLTISSLQERINHLFSLSANPLCYKENKKMMIYMNSGVRDEQYVKSNMISPSHLLDLYNHLDPQVANNIDINLNQSTKLTPYGREKIKSIMDKNNTIIVGFQGDNMKCGHAISFIKQTDSKWFLKDSNIAPVLLDPLAFINPLLEKPLNLIKTGTDYLKKYSSSAFKYISVRFSL